FLVLPFQRQHPLPAVGAPAMPFRADAEQPAEAVGVRQFLVLVAAGPAQLVGERLLARDVVPETDVLAGLRPLGFNAVAVPLGIAPVARPFEAAARPHVGGIAQTDAEGARLACIQA